MLTESQIAQFKRDGFINGGAVLTEAEVEVLRNELERVMAEKDDETKAQPAKIANVKMGDDDSLPVWQVVNIWMASQPYKDLIAHPEITKGLAQLTEATKLRIWHDQIQYKPAEVGGVNMWHQDAPLWPILAPMTEVTAWVALDDVDEENGCMSMVPGSHLWGDHFDGFLRSLESYEAMPDTFEGHAVKVVRCPVKKGEVHYHHALVWHGSHANTSGRPRRAIALHYMTQETRYVASGEHGMKRYVTVADGELLQGEAFPLAYQG